MLKARYEKLKIAFDIDHVIFWSNLSRLNNLLVIMNISMFFLTGLVAKGYFYTFYSLIILSIISVGLLIPTALVRTLRYYWFYFVLELLGLYFLVASVVYWVNNGFG
jgi:uncharacterized membrane protein YjgN (DUF898 family)